jgi:ferredoxin
MPPPRNAGAPAAGTRSAGAPRGRLQVNPIACTGHESCAELLPELVALDEWGYPRLADGTSGPVPPELGQRARRAVRDCPALALLLTADPEPGRR